MSPVSSVNLVPGSTLPASGFRLPASGFRLPASGFRLPASGFRLPAPRTLPIRSGSHLVVGRETPSSPAPPSSHHDFRTSGLPDSRTLHPRNPNAHPRHRLG